jgi:hypothetical protein
MSSRKSSAFAGMAITMAPITTIAQRSKDRFDIGFSLPVGSVGRYRPLIDLLVGRCAFAAILVDRTCA